MGHKYVSFSVRSSNQHQVAAVLQLAKRVAIVTPPQSGYVVAYDKLADEMDSRQILEVGALMSHEAKAVVLAVLNFDDDVLCYWLFENGQLTDSFNSRPNYGERNAARTGVQGGDARRLCTALGAAASPNDVEAILRGKYVFAVEQHESLAKLLELPSWSVGFGYDYVADNALVEEVDQELLIYLK